MFVQHAEHLTANRCKLVLVYDLIGTNTSTNVLQLFQASGTIPYALPAHTPSVLQMCDVVLFSTFKRKLSDSILAAVSPDEQKTLDMYNFAAFFALAVPRF